MKGIHAQFDTLRDSVHLARDREALVHAFARFAASHGFDWFTYLSVHGSEVYGLSNYPAAWQATYLDRNLSSIDPVVEAMNTGTVPLAWSATSMLRGASRKQWQFMDEAKAFDIRSGISIPVVAGYGRRAILTFASGAKEVDVKLVSDPYAAMTLAALVDGQLQSRERGTVMRSPVCPLTPAQRDCLSWLLQGKTSQDIAILRKVGQRAVEFQLQAIRRRLNVLTTYQAIAIAVRHHWV